MRNNGSKDDPYFKKNIQQTVAEIARTSGSPEEFVKEVMSVYTHEEQQQEAAIYIKKWNEFSKDLPSDVKVQNYRALTNAIKESRGESSFDYAQYNEMARALSAKKTYPASITTPMQKRLYTTAINKGKSSSEAEKYALEFADRPKTYYVPKNPQRPPKVISEDVAYRALFNSIFTGTHADKSIKQVIKKTTKTK